VEEESWVQTVVFKGRYYPRHFGVQEKIMNLRGMRRRNADVIKVVHGKF
jgi:hypothetical protein